MVWVLPNRTIGGISADPCAASPWIIDPRPALLGPCSGT